MPNRQKHRGRHPGDEDLFSPARIEVMRGALGDLCWLLARGYTHAASLKLVGDRFSLRKRQRDALWRCACTDKQMHDRALNRAAGLKGQRVAVDGFNAIIVFESMISGGPILVGRDGVRRDLASVHGSYRRVEETAAALDALAELLEPALEVRWLLDQPVSNSGRLAEMIRERGAKLGWSAELVPSPDKVLVETDWLVATSDAWILDNAAQWIDLPSLFESDALWLIDLRSQSTAAPGPIG